MGDGGAMALEGVVGIRKPTQNVCIYTQGCDARYMTKASSNRLLRESIHYPPLFPPRIRTSHSCIRPLRHNQSIPPIQYPRPIQTPHPLTPSLAHLFLSGTMRKKEREERMGSKGLKGVNAAGIIQIADRKSGSWRRRRWTYRIDAL